MKRPYERHTVEQMLDAYENVVQICARERAVGKAEPNSIRRQRNAVEEVDKLRDAIQNEICYRIDHKLDRLGSEMRPMEAG